MSLKKDRFALVALTGWLIATLSLPLIVWAYPLFALTYVGKMLISIIIMIILNRRFIMKVQQRYIRVILQIALLALPITTNISIAAFRFHYRNPSWLSYTAYGDDKAVRIIVWKRSTKKEMSIYQSAGYRDQSWFFIPGLALRGEYKKVAGLVLPGVITEIKNDTINLKSFDKISASLDHLLDSDQSSYNNFRFLGNTFDTAFIHGRVIQFTALKFIPGQDTGCINNPSASVGKNCINTGELQIGNAQSLGIDRVWIRHVLDTALKN